MDDSAFIDCKPYSFVEFNSRFSGSQYFSVLNLNIQSIRNKFESLEVFLSQVTLHFDILCLTETFLFPSEANLYYLDGYKFLGIHRETRGGGVGVYLREGIAAHVEHHELSLHGSEAITLRLRGVNAISDGDILDLTVVYRRPSADTELFLADLGRFLLNSSPSTHIITGDINIDTLKHTQLSSEYLNILSQANFFNTITIPTRLSSCLDHINLNKDNLIVSSGTILTAISDHLPAFICIKNTNSCFSDSYQTLSIRDYKMFSTENFLSDLDMIDWDETVYSQSDVNMMYDQFTSAFVKICDKHAPFKSFRKKNVRYFHKPWLSTDLLKLLKKKDYIYHQTLNNPLNSALKLKLKQMRNKVTKEVRDAKTKYFADLLNSTSDPKKYWDVINQQTGKHRQAFSSPKSILNDEDQDLTNEKDIANCFNSYFTSIGVKLASVFKSSAGNNQPQTKFTQVTNARISCTFSFLPLDKETLNKLFDNIDTRKATGLDGIPAKLIKIAKPVILNPLLFMINSSFESNVFPDSLKLAKVIPLYKKGCTKSCKNYRPISILSTFSKLFEKAANQQIKKYLEMNNILTEHQYGFRSNRSTVDALINLTKTVLSSLDSNKALLGIFIDFSKAFDTINHSILWEKLDNLNFGENATSWLKSYLSNRKQVTVINNSTHSDFGSITIGVPQGSILGPTIFLLYINDLVHCLNKMRPILYADDTNLFFESNDLNRDISIIKDELHAVENWCVRNKLTLNTDKTFYIIIKNYQSNISLKPNSLTLFNKPIAEADNIKFLGVHIDKNFSWRTHIENLCAQIRPTMGALYKCSKFLPTKILIMIYNGLIYSKINYCIEVWGNASHIYLNSLLILQKKIVRIIFKKPPLAHTEFLFKSSSILTISNLYKFRVLLQAHKVFHVSLLNHIQHPYSTRSSLINLSLPMIKTAAAQRGFAYQCAALWNCLPTHLREIRSNASFKRSLRAQLLNS